MLQPKVGWGLSRPDPLSNRIADWLRLEICEGRLPPGERLVEQTLSERFGVSRVPMREALRMVVADGLVEVVPHRGAVVTAMSERELTELFAFRIAIEGFAARAAAEIRPVPTLAAAERLIAAMRTASALGDLGAFHQHGTDFHAELVAASGNRLISASYERLRIRVRRYRAAISAIPDIESLSIREHEAIVAAIREGAGTSARRLAEAHVEGMLTRVREAGLPTRLFVSPT